MKKQFDKIEIGLEKLIDLITLIGGAICIFMVAFLCVSVFAQRILHSPITGVYEICQYLIMPLVCFPGFAYAYHHDLLPKFDLLSNKQNVVWQWFCLIANAAVEILVFAIMTYGAYRFAIKGSVDHVTTFAGSKIFPLYPFYWFSPIGFTILEITILYTHIKKIYQYATRNKVLEQGETDHV